MKPITMLSLTAVLASAQAQTNPAATQTSVATDLKDGKGSVTITVEKDGKKLTRTIVIDENTPFQALADQINEKLGKAGFSDPATPPKKTVTYLGVMLNEPAGFPFTGGTFGGGGGSVYQDGASASDAGGALRPEGLPPGTGLTVTGTTAGSPAEKAGLQAGDVLAKLNDQILINPGQFTTLVRTMKDGEVVKLSLFRQGKTQEITATLGSRVEESMPGTGFGAGAGLPADISRVLTIDPAGNVVESAPGSLLGEAVPPAGGHPSTLNPQANQTGTTPGAEARPLWENALREAAAAKQQAAAQWQEQLSQWRADWTENQKKATQEYRRAMEKMGEELKNAREAAEKAREEARRAIEEVMRNVEEQRKAAPTPTSPEAKPESPKHT